jgi:hypothetical protein
MQKFETRQAIFDHVFTALKKQGRRSGFRIGSYENCYYRNTDNGDKCAAGHLIDDTHYKPFFEGKGAAAECVTDALVASGVSPEHISFVGELQDAHDAKTDTFEGTLNRLRDVAHRHDLTVPA